MGKHNFARPGARDLARNVILQSAMKELEQLRMDGLVEATRQINSWGEGIGDMWRWLLLLLLLWGPCREGREELPQCLLRAL